MVEYNRYPAMDSENNFPPAVRRAFANSPEHAEVISNSVQPLVTRALANDTTISEAANLASETAVTKAVAGLDLIMSDDQRLPNFQPSAEQHLLALLDVNGRETWLGARASDGGPTAWSMSMLNKRMGYEQRVGYESVMFSVTDSNDNMTDLTVRSSDGQFADFVIDRLRKRLGGVASQAAQFAPGDRHVRGSEVLPIMPDMTKIGCWGSSSMEGMGWHIVNSGFHIPGTAMYAGGGKSGENIGQIAARLGSTPALVTVPNGTLPGAKEAVPVTVSNNTYLNAFEGKLAGVLGTISWSSTVNGFVFTRATAGDAVVVPANTPLLPTKGLEHRNAATLLWMGKNDLGNTVGADDRVIKLTDDAYDWLAPLIKRTLVLGHFVNGNTPANANVRKQIHAVNEAHRKRYGDLFLDVQAYVVSSQVWTDTKITPTATDLEQQAMGNKPPSISNDDGHLNNAGYLAVWKLVLAKFQQLGWYNHSL